MRGKSICSALPTTLHRRNATGSHLDNLDLSSPIDQHVLDVTVVLRQHVLGDLVLGQPLEVVQVLHIRSQVRLTCHDPRLHEEGLLTEGLGASRLVDPRFAVGIDMVPGRVVADHPGVHVDAGRLGKGTFGSLETDAELTNLSNKKHMSLESRHSTHLTQSLFHLHGRAGELPVSRL